MATTTRPFRFGAVGLVPPEPEQWIATARRVEELGYSTLLAPDGMQYLSPLPALALAAGATTTLRLGTYVMAGPLRPARTAAWEAHSLSVLTGGRFELGISTGRPEIRPVVEELGLPYGSPADRLRAVADTVKYLRDLDGGEHTPVLVAAGGPVALARAAEIGDTVALATGPLTGRDEVAAMAARVRSAAGARADGVELAANLFVVGDEVPAWIGQFLQVDAATLVAHDSLAMLRGTTAEMVDELRRRRDAFGASYITVNAAFAEQLAPVVERLAGT